MTRLLALLFMLLLAKTAPAQDAAVWKKKGKDLLATQQYRPALEAFQRVEKLGQADAETLANIGICHFHLHQPEQAEAQLQSAFKAKRQPPPIAYLYLAKLRQSTLDFEQAAAFYKDFLRKTPADHPWRPAVRDEIRRCATGMMLRRQPPFAAVLPLADINTVGDEYAPLPSPSGKERLYFSATGRSATGSDIFYTEVKAGDWSAPKPLNRFINSADHETALGFDGSGSNLYFFRGKTPEIGQILVDTFREDPLQHTLFFKAFTGPMRPGEGDCAPFFFNDSILLFASRREGGFGGLDLYSSIRNDDTWTPAKNLGTTINSAYDETSPFLARDGRTLYFSSNDAARSMGGLDVLTATWLDWSHQWSPPQNLGPPVNSAADDEHFSLSNLGDRAFFSSDRITGEGGRDLFVALFDSPREEQLGESWPVAFCLIPEGKKEAVPSERAMQPPGGFFDEISSFELPVMVLPPPGGTPNERTVNQFALLAQLLKKYPRLHITLALHSAPADAPFGAFLFASQTVTDLLRQEGVGMGQVTLLFVGSAYPVEGQERRAEVFVENPMVVPFGLHRTSLPAGAFKAQFFQKSMTSLAYRVVVGSEQVPFDGKAIGKFYGLYPEALLERQAGAASLAFSSGLYLTYAAAEEWRKSLNLDGYTSATIVPYLRGRALTKELAASYVKDFPDLQYFIEN